MKIKMKILDTLGKQSRKDQILVVVIGLLCVGLLVMPSPFKTPFGKQTVRARGRVIETDNSEIQTFGIVRQGEQQVVTEILSGDYKGKVVNASNVLLGKMETDKMFQPDDVALLVLEIRGGELTTATAYDHYRVTFELLLVVLFAVFLIAFAGWSGFRALLSFVFALLLMWKILLPGILLDWDPVLIALGVVTALTAATLYLVAGVNKIAQVALVGSILGILLTIGLSFLLLPPFHLHGAIQPFSETLLYTGFEHLNLTRIFLAAIFIGASGAVLDVAIDVSTSMSEVYSKRPDLSRKELIQSGFVVGRNMTSTMVTTLLMAYASGYMVLLMVFMAQGVPPSQLINTNYVAAEILKTVVGSFGLVTVAPFTAIVGGFLYTATGPESNEQVSRQFFVDPTGFDLEVGMSVTPETPMGIDVLTGEKVYAGSEGRVKQVTWHSDGQGLEVIIETDTYATTPDFAPA